MFAPSPETAMVTPRVLSVHRIDRFLVTRFLSRFGEVVWHIDDTSRSEEDPAGLGAEVYQGGLAGAKGRLRALLLAAPGR